jgi:hypothetical protein
MRAPDVAFFTELLALIICPVGLLLFAVSLVSFIRSRTRTADKIMKRNLVLPLILITLASHQLTAETPKSVAQTSPEGLVAELYKLHEKKQGPFFQTKDHGMVTQYFSERLAQLIWKDAVTAKGEVGALDFDPLYDAQDVDIKKFSLRKSRSEKGSSEVIASFENMGHKTEITFSLVLTKTGWKISDIKYADGRHLVGLLSGK